jgi:hypothetical protein
LPRSSQRFKEVVSDTSTTFEVRMPDKLRAIERICKIMGWDAAPKVEDVPKPPPPSPEDLAKAGATLRKWINFAPRAEDFVGQKWSKGTMSEGEWFALFGKRQSCATCEGSQPRWISVDFPWPGRRAKSRSFLARSSFLQVELLAIHITETSAILGS